MLHPSHYDPNQPRVPKGHEGAGEWTRYGYGSVRLAFSGQPPVVPGLAGGLTAALGLFGTLSARNNPDSQAVISFKAREYRPTEEKILNLEDVAQLDRDQSRTACPGLRDVEGMTDFAAVMTNEKAKETNMRATEYGTAVHSMVKYLVEHFGRGLRPEVSYVKMKEEGVYGTPGSIRIDVLEKREDGTVCVYDIKTGKRGLSPARLVEIASNVYGAYSDATQRIIILEVRPNYRRWINGAYR